MTLLTRFQRNYLVQKNSYFTSNWFKYYVQGSSQREKRKTNKSIELITVSILVKSAIKLFLNENSVCNKNFEVLPIAIKILQHIWYILHRIW